MNMTSRIADDGNLPSYFLFPILLVMFVYEYKVVLMSPNEDETNTRASRVMLKR